MKYIFSQMETEVAKCSIDKKYLEIEKKELSLDNDRLLEHIICQDVMNVVMHADVHNVLPANNNSLEHDNSALELLKHENDRLMELLISQDLVHTTVNSVVAINDYKTMQQSFVDEYNETLVLKAELAKKNDMIEKAIYNKLSKRCSRLENQYYLKHTQANADILREIVKDARLLRPLDSNLASACTFVTRIQELLVYVSATCPSTKHVSDKLVVVTPMNRTRKVRSKQFVQERISKKRTKNEDKMTKPDTEWKSVEKTKSRQSPSLKKCMFDAIHDLYVINYLNDVNAHVKSNSMKSRSAKSKKKKMWKPTGKVYTNVGYSWKPTGRPSL
ncbi:hypothetical protein Tco_1050310 [Tanacetum coccineum]